MIYADYCGCPPEAPNGWDVEPRVVLTAYSHAPITCINMSKGRGAYECKVD